MFESKDKQWPHSQTHIAKKQVSPGVVPALWRLRDEGCHKCEGDRLAYVMRPPLKEKSGRLGRTRNKGSSRYTESVRTFWGYFGGGLPHTILIQT